MSSLHFKLNTHNETVEYYPFPTAMFEQLAQSGITLSSSSCLELECGRGIITKAFQGRLAHITSIHHSAKDITFAKQRNPEAHIIKGNAEYLPFEKESFDIALTCNQWKYFHRNKVLSEVDRVLKPGGHLLLCQTYSPAVDSPIISTTNHLLKQFDMASQAYENKSNNYHWKTEWRKSGFQLKDQWTLSYLFQCNLTDWIDYVLHSINDFPESFTIDLEQKLHAHLHPLMAQKRMEIPLTTKAYVLQK
ncbi:class I SAM-dependent methyltransferase [Pontibacillus litoralis]|uniref:Methyltransferase type 11 domain-containing protein n=1 Tax=Pontibacillus litoralis JSM 072002 TaxID=1385512 RepID=A0A0A5HXB1_9BACI|nr:class I SAM-dependent methyltransferase [Pontibacillus litoralis]KGX88262.1 hypothetical protein N784_10490 [Pontibacillus litoralis JSM 072002]